MLPNSVEGVEYASSSQYPTVPLVPLMPLVPLSISLHDRRLQDTLLRGTAGDRNL